MNAFPIFLDLEALKNRPGFSMNKRFRVSSTSTNSYIGLQILRMKGTVLV